MLQNPSNNEAWPKVLSQDILRHAMGIKNKVHILNGQMKGSLKFLHFVAKGLRRVFSSTVCLLATRFFIVGKTLLPVPAGAERVTDDGANGHQENGHATTTVDSNLLHAIESVVIEWSHQVQDVLKKDSSQALLEGGNPLPGVEVEFWRSRYANLLNIHEQVKYLLFVYFSS